MRNRDNDHQRKNTQHLLKRMPHEIDEIKANRLGYSRNRFAAVDKKAEANKAVNAAKKKRREQLVDESL